MTLPEINEQLDNFLIYQKIKLEIRYNDHNRWNGNAFYQLPTFEYFLKNCVSDKGGNYDFTVRRYKSHSLRMKSHDFRIKVPHTEIDRHYTYSIYMGTHFHFKECIDFKNCSTQLVL